MKKPNLLQIHTFKLIQLNPQIFIHM